MHCEQVVPWAYHANPLLDYRFLTSLCVSSGGVLLLEVDRVLRPGGFWVLSGPPVNFEVHWKGWESTEEKQRRDMEHLQDLLKRMCYKQYNNKDDIMVWQKPSDNSCYEQRDNSEDSVAQPPVCDDHIEADAAWCVSVFDHGVFQVLDLWCCCLSRCLEWDSKLQRG